MNRSTLIGALFFTLAMFGCGIPKQSTPDKFQGMWKLDKFESFDGGSGVWRSDTTRIGYSGLILYDGKGHMGVQLIPKEYKNINSNKDIDSLNMEDVRHLTRLYSANYVYFANYVLSDSSVEHKILSATDPASCGQSLIRNFDFKNDTLILTPQVGIGERKFRLRWIKL